jgi:cell division protein FtsA
MMVASPVASALAVVQNSDLEQGCAVVDQGGGTTSIAVFAGGGVAHTACLPIGASLVTSDLQQLLKTSLDEAERLKLECGHAWAADVDPEEGVDVLQAGSVRYSPR